MEKRELYVALGVFILLIVAFVVFMVHRDCKKSHSKALVRIGSPESSGCYYGVDVDMYVSGVMMPGTDYPGVVYFSLQNGGKSIDLSIDLGISSAPGWFVFEPNARYRISNKTYGPNFFAGSRLSKTPGYNFEIFFYDPQSADPITLWSGDSVGSSTPAGDACMAKLYNYCANGGALLISRMF